MSPILFPLCPLVRPPLIWRPQIQPPTTPKKKKKTQPKNPDPAAWRPARFDKGSGLPANEQNPRGVNDPIIYEISAPAGALASWMHLDHLNICC